MNFVRWLLITLLIDPLIMLFCWNVLAVPMFDVTRTTFTICFIISIIINILWAGIKSNLNNEY